MPLAVTPHPQQTWARAQGANGGYAEPRLDINAPDLYLPTMAFVTYIMLIALHLGQEGRFTPEIFSLTASKGLGLVLLEVTATKLVFYLFPAASSGSGAQILDLVAYSGYKFVGVVVSMAAGLVLPSYGRLAVSLYTALCSGADAAGCAAHRGSTRALTTPAVRSPRRLLPAENLDRGAGRGELDARRGQAELLHLRLGGAPGAHLLVPREDLSDRA